MDARVSFFNTFEPPRDWMKLARAQRADELLKLAPNILAGLVLNAEERHELLRDCVVAADRMRKLLGHVAAPRSIDINLYDLARERVGELHAD